MTKSANDDMMTRSH